MTLKYNQSMTDFAYNFSTTYANKIHDIFFYFWIVEPELNQIYG